MDAGRSWANTTQYQDAEYLEEAYETTSINGFSKCGIWPVNRKVFNDDDFAATDALL